jgi:hypothetical protein
LATPENGTLLSTILLVGGTVYIAVSAAAIGLADGMKTMSDDTYKHTVYSGIIHAAGDATYMMIVTGGAAMAAFIFAASLAIRRAEILPNWLGVFGHVAAVAALFSVTLLYDAGLAALDCGCIRDALPAHQADSTEVGARDGVAGARTEGRGGNNSPRPSKA